MTRVALAVSTVLLTVSSAGSVGLAQPASSSAPVTSAPALELSRLVGFLHEKLVRVDPRTLTPMPARSVTAGSGGCASRLGGTACYSTPPWTASPDGKRLALVRNDLNDVPRLQVVDLARMRITRRIRLNRGPLGALAWLAPGRILAVEEVNGERQRLLAIDLATGRVVADRALEGSALRLEETRQQLIVLLASAQDIGAARLAVAERSGAVRFVPLPRIAAGSRQLGSGSDLRFDSRSPALAVDPDGRRAFVVDTSVVAEVDLASLAVSYHPLVTRPSFFSRLWNWLEPVAQAKETSGYDRVAHWLGDGSLAISGVDMEGTSSKPAGLQVIDTRSWNGRSLDRGATTFSLADGLLLATGESWDARARRATGIGLRAYGVDGVERFGLFEGKAAWVAEVYGGRAFVEIGQKPLRVVQLSSGRVLGVRRQPLPSLLLGPGSGWWG